MADQVVHTIITLGLKLKALYDTVKDNKGEVGRLAARVRVFDLRAAGRGPLADAPGHTAATCAVAFAADDRQLVSSGADGCLLVWNVF